MQELQPFYTGGEGPPMTSMIEPHIPAQNHSLSFSRASFSPFCSMVQTARTYQQAASYAQLMNLEYFQLAYSELHLECPSCTSTRNKVLHIVSIILFNDKFETPAPP